VTEHTAAEGDRPGSWCAGHALAGQGKQKAITAMTHKILVIAWHLLSTGTLYDDPGAAAVHEDHRRAATP